MLFKAEFWSPIRRGEVTVAFRTWKRPTVSEGGTLQSPVGVLSIDEVTPIDEADVTDADARAAGFGSPAEVLASVRPGDDRQLYRVRFHRAGDDPRTELRNRSDLTDDDRAELDAQLARWDRASRDGAWTARVLADIAAHPASRSADMAERLDVDQAQLKRRVRQLKNLGLTESLGTGYRLSPRGESHRSGRR